MNRPNTFIIGAPKCGTSALYSYLRSHPDVFMPAVKEPHYFCYDFDGLRRFPTEPEYLNLFAPATSAHKIIGEATSRYLYSREAVPALRAFAPGAKLIVMLRNPIDLVHSLHAQLLYQYTEDETDFWTAWRLQRDRKLGLSIPPGCPCVNELFYGDVASLGSQMQRMYEWVPRSDCHVILYDDFKRDPRRAYLGALDFLGLEDDGRQTFAKVNPHKKYRSDLLAKLVVDPPFPLSTIKSGLKQTFGWKETRFGRWVYAKMTVPTQRSPMDLQVQSELAAFFHDDIQLLSDQLGRDLSHWTKTQSIAA